MDSHILFRSEVFGYPEKTIPKIARRQDIGERRKPGIFFPFAIRQSLSSACSSLIPTWSFPKIWFLALAFSRAIWLEPSDS